MTPWVRWAVIIFPALSILVCLVTWADASGWAQYFHGLRVLFDNIGRVPPPKPPTVPVASYAGSLVIAPEIVFAMWQYRAATFARALQYPARHGPGWGIGAYLVPIADLFVPVQALGDCLPPGDPGRRLVTRTWAALLVVSVLQLPMIVFLAEARPVGLAFMVVVIAADLVLVHWGRQMVDAIADNHRQATGRSRQA
ncbi:MAG: DUF4328 domain-containing protein [Actinomycetota bacterium]|nr:DUF4328 domain-containing protein [Actinomycetota bacterium]